MSENQTIDLSKSKVDLSLIWGIDLNEGRSKDPIFQKLTQAAIVRPVMSRLRKLKVWTKAGRKAILWTQVREKLEAGTMAIIWNQVKEKLETNKRKSV